jgi:RNA polymerase sigma-70 factor (ECF subfamily)
MKLVRDEAAVDDLVQLTLLKAHLARERFELQGGDPDGAVQAWYLAIGRNVAMDHLRQRYRAQQRSPAAAGTDDDADPVMELPDEGNDPEMLGAMAEREQRIIAEVRDAIASLPPGQREVVVLHKLRGMSMAEIADRLDVREGAVRVRAHRAYRALARLLQPKTLGS